MDLRRNTEVNKFSELGKKYGLEVLLIPYGFAAFTDINVDELKNIIMKSRTK